MVLDPYYIQFSHCHYLISYSHQDINYSYPGSVLHDLEFSLQFKILYHVTFFFATLLENKIQNQDI